LLLLLLVVVVVVAALVAAAVESVMVFYFGEELDVTYVLIFPLFALLDIFTKFHMLERQYYIQNL
jgi:hypothetical protein